MAYGKGAQWGEGKWEQIISDSPDSLVRWASVCRWFSCWGCFGNNLTPLLEHFTNCPSCLLLNLADPNPPISHPPGNTSQTFRGVPVKPFLQRVVPLQRWDSLANHIFSPVSWPFVYPPMVLDLPDRFCAIAFTIWFGLRLLFGISHLIFCHDLAGISNLTSSYTVWEKVLYLYGKIGGEN